MTPEETREDLENQIEILQRKLNTLNKRLRDRRHAAALIGTYLQKITWAPEVSNGIPQIFSWTFEEDLTVKEISEKLFLKQAPALIPLPSGDVSISLVDGRLWITAPAENLRAAIENWDLDVEDLSHVFEKLDRIRKNTDFLEKFCLSLFPLKEVLKP